MKHSLVMFLIRLDLRLLIILLTFNMKWPVVKDGLYLFVRQVIQVCLASYCEIICSCGTSLLEMESGAFWDVDVCGCLQMLAAMIWKFLSGNQFRKVLSL